MKHKLNISTNDALESNVVQMFHYDIDLRQFQISCSLVIVIKSKIMCSCPLQKIAYNMAKSINILTAVSLWICSEYYTECY
jgi:hypothetical protein